jgi:hypothetical protein
MGEAVGSRRTIVKDTGESLDREMYSNCASRVYNRE